MCGGKPPTALFVVETCRPPVSTTNTRLPPRRYRLRDTRRIMNECLQGEI